MNKISLTKENKIYLLGCLIFILGAIVGSVAIASGQAVGKYNIMLSGVMFIWITNIIFCFFKIKQRVITLLFHLTIFLFLLSRIVIAAFRGVHWWTIYSVGANIFAIKAITYSLIFICLGNILLEIICNRLSLKKTETSEKKKTVNAETLRFVIRIGLIVCMVCFFLSELDKLAFMSGRPYSDYYIYYKSDLPFYISFPAGCMTYFLCMFLALKPKKTEAFIWLAIYVVSALPMLKIGARGDLILNLIFAFTYYCLRSMYEKGWFGKVERIIAVICIPIMVIMLGAYNYIRDGKEIKISVVELASDFMYRQGTTYDTVLQGYEYQDKLVGKDHKYYSFGAVTDYTLYNTLGKKIFDAPPITDGNSFKNAYNSHSFSHAISYVVLGADYIGGHGRGSSYIIENYLDFGFTGVIVFSLLLGVICSGCMLFFGKKWLLSVVILNILLDLFFTARAESLAFLKFLFSYKFWIVILGIIILSLIANYIIEKLNLKKFMVIRFILEH